MTKLHARTVILSKAGGRSHNEDACGYRNDCWVVADGLGGHGGGDIAARLTVDVLLQRTELLFPLDSKKLILAFAEVEQAIWRRQQAEPRLHQMRTTAVMLCSDGYSVLWAHVGDSRLYHVRKGRVYFQTHDHSVPQAMVTAGEITPAEIRFHEDRNRLLRSLGGSKYTLPTVAKFPITLHNKDIFLLCSDGFWEHVTEAEMEATLAEINEPQQWLESMNEILLKRAPVGHDNYTAIAIFFERNNWHWFSLA